MASCAWAGARMTPSASPSTCSAGCSPTDPRTPGGSTVFYDDDGGGGDDEPAAWHGLRVRIGIHVGGAGEWRSVWDPVQHRFDYHGPAVNLAARIVNRAQGGQTLVSAAVRSADDDTAATVCWTDLGPHHHLRGIDEPVHLYQALPTDEPLCRRTFLLQRRASSSAVLRWPNIHHTLTVLSLPDEGGGGGVMTSQSHGAGSAARGDRCGKKMG